MIELTPLDVRNKRGDFRKTMRGYDPEEVDSFLELVSERFEDLVKEGLTLRERVDRLQEQVSHQEGREQAVHEALVTAQALRKDVKEQARRESDLLVREAEVEVGRILETAERRLEERKSALEEMERLRLRFLRSFRSLLERELDAVEIEEERKPLDDTPLEIEFTVGELREKVAERKAAPPSPAEPEPLAESTPPVEPVPSPAPPEPSAEASEPTSAKSEPAREDGDDGPLWLSSVLMEEENDDEDGADDEGEKRNGDAW